MGPTAEGDHLLELPLTKEAAEADPAWYDHYCFVGMGDHFIQVSSDWWRASHAVIGGDLSRDHLRHDIAETAFAARSYSRIS